MAGKVKVIQQGRSGTVQYTEGWLRRNTCDFCFEFGEGDTVATIWFTPEDKWDGKYPWAAGRGDEIVRFVAEELRRTQAPKSVIEWESDRFHLVNR